MKTPVPALAAMVFLLFLCGCGGAGPDDAADHARETLAWQADRAAGLTADQGWLTLIGLFWLEPGAVYVIRCRALSFAVRAVISTSTACRRRRTNCARTSVSCTAISPNRASGCVVTRTASGTASMSMSR